MVDEEQVEVQQVAVFDFLLRLQDVQRLNEQVGLLLREEALQLELAVFVVELQLNLGMPLLLTIFSFFRIPCVYLYRMLRVWFSLMCCSVTKFTKFWKNSMSCSLLMNSDCSGGNDSTTLFEAKSTNRSHHSLLYCTRACSYLEDGIRDYRDPAVLLVPIGVHQGLVALDVLPDVHGVHQELQAARQAALLAVLISLRGLRSRPVSASPSCCTRGSEGSLASEKESRDR